jgi:hypothetical protein
MINFQEINSDEYSAPEYLSDEEKKRFNQSIVCLHEMSKLIKKTADTANTAEIPSKLLEGLKGIIEDFESLKKDFDKTRIAKANYNPNDTFNRVSSIHSNFFEPSSSNKNLIIIGAISNYEFFFGERPLKKLNDINYELDKKNERVDEILKKLENPSAERVLGDYAIEYAKEETKNNTISFRWIVAGIISTGLFITLIVFSIYCEWFPSKLRLENTSGNINNSSEIINVPVLVTKVMLVSLIIYFILFCFKQYSIYKHLAIVNQQKKNAFSSYNLFAAAVGDKDVEAKKVLLMSLARTIHESINSGFLSSKQSEQPLIQNVDMGKLTSWSQNS